MNGPNRAIWREVALLYGATLVVTAGLTWLQGSVGWVRSYALVIVAATFLYLPIEVLHRKQLDPADFGIHRRRPIFAMAFALMVMAVCFPPYLIGFHYWQTETLKRSPAVESARFDRWPVELQDNPRLRRLHPGEVRLHAVDDRLALRWRLPTGQSFVARIESDAPLTPISGPLQAAADRRSDTSTHRLGIDARSDGQAVFDAPGQTLSVTIEAGGDRLPPDRLKLGTALIAAESNPYRAERSYWWLINLILVQLLLVALPEEVFYRGYLQTRLDGLIGREVKVLGVSVNLTSMVVTSALFAIGHVVTVPAASRLAVFFPSLLFGWMRRATGGILAPVIFHAACNLIVEVASAYYAR